MKRLLITVLILLLVFNVLACSGSGKETKPEPKPKESIVVAKLENVILDLNMDKEIGVILIDGAGETYDIIFREHFDYNMAMGGGSITKNLSNSTVSIGDDYLIGFMKDDVEIITFKKDRSYEIVLDGSTITEIKESK